MYYDIAVMAAVAAGTAAAGGDTVARTSCTDFAKRLIEADDAGVADAFVGVAGHDYDHDHAHAHAADIPQLPSNPDPCFSLVVILYSHMCPNYRQYYWHLYLY